MSQTAVSVRKEEGIRAIEALVFNVAKILVDDAERVVVTATRDERGMTISLVVAPADLAMVIGKQGRTARSIRSLLQAAGLSLGQTLSLNIQAAQSGG